MRFLDLFRQLSRHEAAALPSDHEAHHAVIRDELALVAHQQQELGGPVRVIPSELHAAARFYPAGPIAPGVEANPCLVVADQAVFVHLSDDGVLVVNVEVEAHDAFPGDAVPIRFEILGQPIVSFDDDGRRRVHPDPRDQATITARDGRSGPGH